MLQIQNFCNFFAFRFKNVICLAGKWASRNIIILVSIAKLHSPRRSGNTNQPNQQGIAARLKAFSHTLFWSLAALTRGVGNETAFQPERRPLRFLILVNTSIYTYVRVHRRERAFVYRGANINERVVRRSVRSPGLPAARARGWDKKRAFANGRRWRGIFDDNNRRHSHHCD